MDSVFSAIAEHLGLAMVWALLHMVCFLLVTYHCLMRMREPSSTVLWIFVAWSLPILGPLLYLSFGVDRVPTKGWRKQVHDDSFLAERRARESETFPLAYWRAMYDRVAAEPVRPVEQKINRTLQSILPDFPLLGGNDVNLLVGGGSAFAAMLAAIEGARHHVHIQTFIIADDTVGRRFMELLADKARAGVEVRLLYDRFGATGALLGGLFRRYRGVANFRIVGWTQANPMKRQFQVNLRNHRKALIVDGRTAFCGGINLQDQAMRDGEVRDYHIRLFGPAALELQYTFLRDWNFMTEEGPDALLRDGYFPHSERSEGALVRLVNSGPTSEMEAVCDAFFAAISAAEKQILIATAYFVPGPDMRRALRIAALRGVDVRLVVPRKSNHIYVGLAAQALFGELLDAGVRVYRRRPPFMHAKACMIDSCVALVGTANMDIRSLRLNYETNLAVHDENFANEVKRAILDELSVAEEIERGAWQRRPVVKRLAENAAALLAPVL